MAINSANIPGFSGLTAGASGLVKSLMSGQVAPGTRKAIYDAGAERGVAGGMPGSTGIAGSLFANADLRNIGRASEDQQQKGFQDLLAMIAGYSGTVAPTAGQDIQNQQFGRQMGLEETNAELQRRLASAEGSRAWEVHQAKYGPKRMQFGTIKNNRFTTDLSQPGDFGATGATKGFNLRYDPISGSIL